MLKFINLEKKIWHWIVLFFLAFIWGTSFILMKKGLQSYTSTQLAAFRMFFSFVFFIPFIISKFKYLKKEYIKSLVIIGFIGSFFPAFLFAEAQTNINSSLAGMLNSLTPIFVLIVGIIFYKTKTKMFRVIGIIIGLLGASGLFLKNMDVMFSNINYYGLFIVLATFFYGINANEVKNKLKDLDGITISALSFLFIGPIAGVILLFSDFSAAIQTPNYLINLGYIAILSFFSSFFAGIIFNVLIKKTTAIFASSVTYIIPIFAIFWGFVDGEKINFIQLISITIILLGVYLVKKKEKN